MKTKLWNSLRWFIRFIKKDIRWDDTFGDKVCILDITERDLLKVRGFGKKTLNEFRTLLLVEYNIELKK